MWARSTQSSSIVDTLGHEFDEDMLRAMSSQSRTNVQSSCCWGRPNVWCVSKIFKEVSIMSTVGMIEKTEVRALGQQKQLLPALFWNCANLLLQSWTEFEKQVVRYVTRFDEYGDIWNVDRWCSRLECNRGCSDEVVSRLLCAPLQRLLHFPSLPLWCRSHLWNRSICDSPSDCFPHKSYTWACLWRLSVPISSSSRWEVPVERWPCASCTEWRS